MSSKPCTRCRSSWYRFLCSFCSLDIFSALLSSSQLFASALALFEAHFLFENIGFGASAISQKHSKTHFCARFPFCFDNHAISHICYLSKTRFVRDSLPKLQLEVAKTTLWCETSLKHLQTLQVEVVTRKLFFLHSPQSVGAQAFSPIFLAWGKKDGCASPTGWVMNTVDGPTPCSNRIQQVNDVKICQMMCHSCNIIEISWCHRGAPKQRPPMGWQPGRTKRITSPGSRRMQAVLLGMMLTMSSRGDPRDDIWER